MRRIAPARPISPLPNSAREEGSGTGAPGVSKCKLSNPYDSSKLFWTPVMVKEVNASVEIHPKEVPSMGPMLAMNSVPPPDRFRVRANPEPSPLFEVSHVPPAPNTDEGT